MTPPPPRGPVPEWARISTPFLQSEVAWDHCPLSKHTDMGTALLSLLLPLSAVTAAAAAAANLQAAVVTVRKGVSTERSSPAYTADYKAGMRGFLRAV